MILQRFYLREGLSFSETAVFIDLPKGMETRPEAREEGKPESGRPGAAGRRTCWPDAGASRQGGSGAGPRRSGQSGWGWGQPGRGSGPAAGGPCEQPRPSARVAGPGGTHRPSAPWRRRPARCPLAGSPPSAPGSTPASRRRRVLTATRPPRWGGGACDQLQAYRHSGSGSSRGRAGRLERAQWATPAGTRTPRPVRVCAVLRVRVHDRQGARDTWQG